MKPPHLLLSVASLALVSITLPAAAQSYDRTYTKGGDRLMNDTQRIDTERSEPMEQTYTAPARRSVTDKQSTNYTEDSYEGFTGVYFGGDVGYAMGNSDI